jgi:hypothetical protein
MIMIRLLYREREGVLTSWLQFNGEGKCKPAICTDACADF